MLRAIAVALLLSLGCVSHRSVPDPAVPERAAPDRATAAVIDAVRIGHQMYRFDAWAAQASDAVLAQLPAGGPTSVGWVVEEQDGKGIVTFPNADGQTTLAQVTFPVAGKPAVVFPPTGSELSPLQHAMFAARKSAIAAPFEPCSDNYNTIVLPASVLRRAGWFVYLVPATTKSHVMQVGGHYRVHVADDGRVLELMRFSKSCLTLDVPRTRGSLTVEGVYFTHLVTDTPVESHVFLNLLHRIDIMIATRSGIWKLHQGSAIWMGELKD